MSIYSQPVLILDFGSQYTKLIARNIRELEVFCLIKPFDISLSEISKINPAAIILSGGPETVTASNSPTVTNDIFTLNIPILGICYGMQLIAKLLGGKVINADQHEYGDSKLTLTSPSALFEGIPESFNIWMSHGDIVANLPQGFVAIGSSNNSPISAFENNNNKIYGIQFHPEVSHTEYGKEMIANFLFNICMLAKNWQTKDFITDKIQDIKNIVGSAKVVLGLSGGVDSAVVAALMHEAIGNNLYCIMVDNGLLRQNEVASVLAAFNNLAINIEVVSAANEFYSVLEGVECPETKRKLIGEKFIRIFEQEALKIGDVKFLAQGTIYPDVIESAGESKTAHVIKSHHNVGGLPEDVSLEIIEPLRMLFKDEVRKVGRALGIPDNIINRHPFPGPGLGIRILGEFKSEFVEVLQQADAIYQEVLAEYDLHEKISQAFAVFLPVKTVGVKGDARVHEYVIGLRAVVTTDFMTAKVFEMPYTVLTEISTRILNNVKHVARVVYDVSTKPPATIEWE